MRTKAFVLLQFVFLFGLINAQDVAVEEKSINRNGVYFELGGNGGNHGLLASLT